ncbi:unannotated protein [freshwater metagenome]|uniref:Unannotated protein n=1 Tax=freshwater metagenome TaxID=449393 RepID=A0A6J6U8F9_9ZZZZ
MTTDPPSLAGGWKVTVALEFNPDPVRAIGMPGTASSMIDAEPPIRNARVALKVSATPTVSVSVPVTVTFNGGEAAVAVVPTHNSGPLPL